jgi:RHS repeat-associated protein
MSLTYGYAATIGASGAGTTPGNSGQLMSISGTINGQSRSQSFTYDNVGRLLTATGWSLWNRRFAFDRWGNRTGMWDAISGGNQLQNIAIATTGGVANNRIANVNGVTYSYDASGNCTGDGAHSYAYDGEGRQASVDSGATTSSAYDSANRRLKKIAGGATTHYVWEGAQVIAEYNGSTGALISEYVYAGSRMVARDQGGVLRYFHQDRLSTRLITDASGTVVGTEDHLPFGQDAGTTGETEKHRFTSYERDAESGTDYAINRQYSSPAGRFSGPDPFSGSYDLFDPQSLNRYAYAQNDGVNFTDSLGLFRYKPPTPPPPIANPEVPDFSNNPPIVIVIGLLPGVPTVDPGEPPKQSKKRDCNFLAFSQLSKEQQALLMSIGGASGYNNLSDAQKAAFLNITGALSASGIDLSGLVLSGVEQDRLLFEPGSTDKFQGSVETAIANGSAIRDIPLASLHKGAIPNDFGARQYKAFYAWQVGTGGSAPFADIDIGNPRMGLLPLIAHGDEFGLHHIFKSKTDPFRVGKHLGKKITGYECK